MSFALGAAPAAGISVELLTPKFGRRVLMAGALLNATGFASYVWVSWHYGLSISSWQMAGPLVVAGIGFGLVVAPMIDLILTDVPVEDAGSASGLLNTTQQVGMALGVALVGVLFFTHLDNGSDYGVDQVTPQLRQDLSSVGVPPNQQDVVVSGFRACVRDRSAGSDPTVVPASCESGAAQPASPELQKILASAGTTGQRVQLRAFLRPHHAVRRRRPLAGLRRDVRSAAHCETPRPGRRAHGRRRCRRQPGMPKRPKPWSSKPRAGSLSLNQHTDEGANHVPGRTAQH